MVEMCSNVCLFVFVVTGNFHHLSQWIQGSQMKRVQKRGKKKIYDQSYIFNLLSCL